MTVYWNLARTFTDKEQKCVSEFFYFKYLSHGRLYCNTLHKLFDSGSWQTNRNKRKRWHPLREWCFVINTAQHFCINDCIWYPINWPECQSVILALTAYVAFGKQSAKQNLRAAWRLKGIVSTSELSVINVIIVVDIVVVVLRIIVIIVIRYN